MASVRRRLDGPLETDPRAIALKSASDHEEAHLAVPERELVRLAHIAGIDEPPSPP